MLNGKHTEYIVRLDGLTAVVQTAAKVLMQKELVRRP